MVKISENWHSKFNVDGRGLIHGQKFIILKKIKMFYNKINKK